MNVRGLICGLVSTLLIFTLARSGITEPMEFKMGGFIASQYVNDTKTKDPAVDNSLKFKHARLHIIGTVDENTDAFLQIENATGVNILSHFKQAGTIPVKVVAKTDETSAATAEETQ